MGDKVRIVRSGVPPLDVQAPIALAAGNFDGLHRGHQDVIHSARGAAGIRRGQAWVLTFEPHPLQILRPEVAPPMLMTGERKLERLAELELDGVLVLPFTRRFSRLSPGDFVVALRRTVPALRHMTVGRDWRFGFQAEGTVDTLRRLGAEHGFEVTAVPPRQVDGAPVSSTRLRQAVYRGDFEAYRRLAGEPYCLTGTVIGGRKVGRQLGFPTANFLPEMSVLPPRGVFAVSLETDGIRHWGAGYYGHRSLDDTTPPRDIFEAYLFDFDGDLYGARIEVRLFSYIRPDRRFESHDALQAQIAADTAAIRRLLEDHRAGLTPAAPPPTTG